MRGSKELKGLLVIALCSVNYGLSISPSFPVLRYKLCYSRTPQSCFPSDFASNSTFIFGDISYGTIFYDEKPRRPSLSVSCTSARPLCWILDAMTDDRVKSVKEAATYINGDLTYYYQMFFDYAPAAFIRCQSHGNSSLAAEVFVTPRHKVERMRYLNSNDHVLEYTPAHPDAPDLIVPCIRRNYDERLDFSSMMVARAPVSAMLMDTPSEACIQCYPQAPGKQDASSCDACGRFGLTQEFWRAAGSPRSSLNNRSYISENDEFRSCAMDHNCSINTIKAGPVRRVNCNGDNLPTCSDLYAAYKAFPQKCGEQGQEAEGKFENIESCMMRLVGTPLTNRAVVTYDPRVGFRIRGTRDFSSIYKCPRLDLDNGPFFHPHDPGQRFSPNLSLVMSPSQNSLEGIKCVVPKRYGLNLRFGARSCSSLFECEINRRVFQGEPHMVPASDTSWGVPTDDPSFLGRIILGPPTHGIVTCGRFFEKNLGYITEEAFFFQGLDNRMYFTSDNFPPEAVVQVRFLGSVSQQKAEMSFACEISTFILFPTFLLAQEFRNGSNSTKIIQMDTSPDPKRFRAIHSFSFFINEHVLRISCSAPLRNSKGWSTNGIRLQGILPNDTRDVVTDQSVYSMTLILLTILIILLACGLAAAKFTRWCNLTGNSVVNQGLADSYRPEESMELRPMFELGFHPSLAISASDLQMDSNQVIGEGRFGRCLLGKYKGVGVAVKVLKDTTDPTAVKEFAKEVKLMAAMAKHDHIVELIGASMDTAAGGALRAVVELSPLGDLLSYLRRQNRNQAAKYIDSSFQVMEIRHLCYACQQVASGMEYLAKQRIIHGDLAARNILVFPDFIVKITDYGLSRKLYNYSLSYAKDGNVHLPWRWMALESLQFMEFSAMSDMWAFGVTVWEIFTMGQVPFSQLNYCSSFQQKLKQGLRLERPRLASDSVYRFMASTWSIEKFARPGFTTAKEFFENERREAEKAISAACE